MKLIIGSSVIALALSSCMFAGDFTMPNVKEGLWETTTTHSMSGLPGMSDDMLAKLPPDQRARVEEMMKQRGMSMNGNTTTIKSCVTRQKIHKGMAFADNRDNCTHDFVNSSVNHFEVKFHCDETSKDGSKATVDGKTVVDVVDSDSAKGMTHMVTSSNGRDVTMDVTFSSKFLASDCGDIK
jgi:hypothetical protein